MSAILTIERLKAEDERLARGRARLKQMAAKQEQDEAEHAERVHEFVLLAVRKRGITAGDLPALLDDLKALGAGRKDDATGDRKADDTMAAAPAPEPESTPAFDDAAVGAPELEAASTLAFDDAGVSAPERDADADPAGSLPTRTNTVHLLIRKGRNSAKAAELNRAGWRWYGRGGGYWHCYADPAEVERRIADARAIFGEETAVEKEPPGQPAPAVMRNAEPAYAEDSSPNAQQEQDPEPSMA